MKIVFMPSNGVYKLQAGKTLMHAAIEMGIPIDGNCASAGICGKCKVRVVKGNDTELTPEEKALLTEREIKQGYRLACQFIPTSDVIAEIIPVGSGTERKSSMMLLPEFWKEETTKLKHYIVLPDNTLDDQASELDKIKRILNRNDISAKRSVLIKAEKILKERRDVTVCVIDDVIVDIEEGNTEPYCYGIAFDIGTTTVVGALWDISKKKMLGALAKTNPQGVHGADVISRITYAAESDENLRVLHYNIKECLNDIMKRLAVQARIPTENIYRCAVVGNTTMSHIFAGVQPEQLALAPYTPVFCSALKESAGEARLHMNANGDVYLLPNIAGHVGSDITAGLLATNMMNEEQYHLLIDIGTNGELVLAGKGKAFTCSTAAGPAFEGASISRGMRAASGAIEAVAITEGKVKIKTIDNAAPIGICGSGIIDAVGQLVKNKIVTKSGKLLKPDELQKQGFPESIASRSRKGSHGWEFVLYFGKKGDTLSISQKDIREVQLAKAAMAVGTKILLEHMGITEAELDKVSIAGAFGSYVNIENALQIGLLPKVDVSIIDSIGNAAGVGASMSVLSDKIKREAERQAKEIEHIELASSDGFQEKYITATLFS